MKKILASLSAMFLSAVSMDSITAMNNPAVSETEAQNFEAQKTRFQQAYNRCDFQEMISTIKQVEDSNRILELLKLAESINVIWLIGYFEKITELDIRRAVNTIPHEKFVQDYPHLSLSVKNFIENDGKFNFKDMVMIGDQFKDWGRGSCFTLINECYEYLSERYVLTKNEVQKIEKDYLTLNEKDKLFVFFLAIKYHHLDLAAKILQIESQSKNIGERYADLFNLVSRLITPYWLIYCDNRFKYDDTINKDSYLALSSMSYGNADFHVIKQCAKVDWFKNESSSMRDDVARYMVRRSYSPTDELLSWCEECWPYMDDSQVSKVLSITQTSNAKKLSTWMQNCYKWLIDNKKREQTISIIAQSIINASSVAYDRWMLINQFFNDEEKIKMLNFVLNGLCLLDQPLENTLWGYNKSFVQRIFENVAANQENYSNIISCFIPMYRKDNNINNLKELINIVDCHVEYESQLLFYKTFINEFVWTLKEL